jgi:hypothetical protein
LLIAVVALAAVWQGGRDANAGGLVVQDLTGATTAQDLAESLLGGGIVVSNVTYTGSDSAAGLFGGGSGIIGFESGVLLSSGQAQNVVGPNGAANSGTGLGQAGDSDLTALSGNNTNDAAVLEFDFVPSTNLIVFEYVFASEEYNEYVGSQFNDVFAFYANGTNCAVVPNPANPVASLPVSVNTVNNGDSNTSSTNPGLYTNNDPFNADSTGSTVGSPLDTQMDGLTKVLTCSAQVQAGVSNHMKLAIADASDSIYDSAVFIKGGSFVSAEGRVSGRVLGPAPDSDDLVLIEGSMVAVCSGGPPCPTSITNALGEFVVMDLPEGSYHIIAYPPPGRNDLLPADLAISLAQGESKNVGDMMMRKAVAPPAGVTIASIGSIGGVPVIAWDKPAPFSVPGCVGGTASFKLIDTNGNVLDSGPMSESPPGTYNGTIGPLSPYHGPARVEVDIMCPDGSKEEVDFDVYIDPSGNVRTTQGLPIEGATVTLYRSESEAGPFTVVPDGSAIMSPSNRNNPDLTNEDGFFHWDTIAGYYIVRAEKAGCHAPGNPGQAFNETDVLPVPPPQLGLEILLECDGGGTPGPTTPAPSVTAPPGGQEIWGDGDCSGSVNPVDSLKILRKDAGIDRTGVLGACPTLGTQVMVNGVLRRWSDIDCSGALNPVDSLKTLIFDAGGQVTKSDPSCPNVGTAVNLGGGSTPTKTASPTPVATATPTASATATASPTKSATPTGTQPATATPTQTASPTASPTAGVQPILFCWIAIVTNDFINGAIDDEFCTPNGGNVYTCDVPDLSTVNCSTAAAAADYNCDFSFYPPADCQSDGTGGFPDYTCTASGSNMTCSTASPGWPDYTCNAASSIFISCTTPEMTHPDFDCTVSGLQYSCDD